MDLTPTDIELHIEELLLDGFPRDDRAAIAAALQQELTRLLTEEGIPRSLYATLKAGQGGQVEVGRLNASAREISPTQKAETIGSQIARSVYHTMSSDGGTPGH